MPRAQECVLAVFLIQISVKEGEEWLLKKAPKKILRVSYRTRISTFVVPTTKEAPTGNSPMGAIPLKAVTNRFLQTEENKTSEAHNRGRGQGNPSSQ